MNASNLEEFLKNTNIRFLLLRDDSIPIKIVIRPLNDVFISIRDKFPEYHYDIEWVFPGTEEVVEDRDIPAAEITLNKTDENGYDNFPKEVGALCMRASL
jgi:hypothetical protein